MKLIHLSNHLKKIHAITCQLYYGHEKKSEAKQLLFLENPPQLNRISHKQIAAGSINSYFRLLIFPVSFLVFNHSDQSAIFLCFHLRNFTFCFCLSVLE